MRLSSFFIVLLAFFIGAVGSIFAARAAVGVVESRSVVAVRFALDEQSFNWATVQGDGLQVILEGVAPTEATRFRAISTAGTIVDAARVIDGLSVQAQMEIAPPRFSIEILRNDSGVSLIGLIPASQDRDALSAEIAEVAQGSTVVDLLEVADYPVPAGWNEALAYSLRALADLPRSKISVDANRVAVTAISDSPEQKRVLEAALGRRQPQGVEVFLSISAPRPVITPFTLRFIIDEDGGHFDACSADTDGTRREILTAARAAGFEGDVNCTLGLGVPSRTWGAAAAMSITALSDLGGGTVTFSDADITLIVNEGTEQGEFDRVVGELENNLPEVFALFSVLPETPDAEDAGPPEFTATRSPEGEVQLRGRIKDALMNAAAENYARARLGTGAITMGTRLDPDLPANWSVRVLAGIEALAELSNGVVIVQPDLVIVRGNTGREDASARISQLLSEKLGEAEDFRIEVTYVEALDPVIALAIPTPEECIEQIEAVTAASKITFEPGSATIDASTQAAMDHIAEILEKCVDVRIQIAGYTDSQGREVMNQQLSQERAEAIVTALRSRRVLTGNFEAVGFGEDNPIADNGTEAGRDANRRIEFNLILPDPVPEEETGLEALEGGIPIVTAPEETDTEETDAEIPEDAPSEETE